MVGLLEFLSVAYKNCKLDWFGQIGFGGCVVSKKRRRGKKEFKNGTVV